MELPKNLDTKSWLLSREQDGALLHLVPQSAALAADLFATGEPGDAEVAGRIVRSVLAAQQLDRRAPYYGAFPGQLEEPGPEDLNMVQFVLGALIPARVRFGDRLSDSIRAAIERAVRVGLEEVERVDVSISYTNIACWDIHNRCLGGQLLRDDAITRRGKQKLLRWAAYTNESGTSTEFNNPTYTTLAVQIMTRLSQLTKDREVATVAKVMAARLALTIGLHIHTATGRWAGPHGRAYYPTVIGLPGASRVEAPELTGAMRFVNQGDIPWWVAALITDRPVRDMVRETADAASDTAISTLHRGSFALGVAWRDLANQAIRAISWQSNVFTFHYARPESDKPGSVFTRYILDDKWFGDFHVSLTRKAVPVHPHSIFPDEGSFCGVQEGERAIGLYAPETLGASEPHGSAKAIVAWPRWGAPSDEVWIGEERVRSFPAAVPQGATVVVASGDAMLAIRPLELTDLGGGAPVRFVMRDDFLVLELYNYLGPSKTFWELAWPGAFYQGRPRCGFYAEAAERKDYGSPAEFVRAVARGVLVDEAAPAFTYRGEGRRPWRVEYSRDGRTVGIEVDLMEWKRAARRWTHAGELDWPMLESAVARETRDGVVRVGEAELRCGKAAAWLLALPDRQLYVAAYHGPEPAPFSLVLPEGSVEIDSMGTGLVVWDRGQVSVDAVALSGTPRITGGVPAMSTVGGSGRYSHAI